MKRKLIISALILAIVISSMSFGAFAASSEYIQVLLNKEVKINLNGEAWQPKDQSGNDIYPLTYNGTTYLPVRSAAEALNIGIGYDAPTNTVLLGDVQVSAVASFDVDKSLVSGPMELRISKVTLDPAYKSSEYSDPINAVIFAVEVENSSADTVTWHPAQGEIVLNTKEQAETGLFNSDDVGGEFKGEVIKKGNIVFEVESNLDGITNIEYFVSGAFDDGFDRIGEDVMVEIELD